MRSDSGEVAIAVRPFPFRTFPSVKPQQKSWKLSPRCSVSCHGTSRTHRDDPQRSMCQNMRIRYS